MEKIKKYLLKNFELVSEIQNENGYITNLYAQSKNNKIKFQIVCPSKSTNDSFVLQFAPAISFDRWSVSGKRTYFDDDVSLINYLKYNKLYIYECVLTELSYDYEELDDMLLKNMEG